MPDKEVQGGELFVWYFITLLEGTGKIAFASYPLVKQGDVFLHHDVAFEAKNIILQ